MAGRGWRGPACETLGQMHVRGSGESGPRLVGGGRVGGPRLVGGGWADGPGRGVDLV